MSVDEVTHLEATMLAAEGGIAEVRRRLATHGLVLIQGFEPTTEQFIGFLQQLGEPLDYYGEQAGTHPEHAAIWRIRYEREAFMKGQVHGSDGPLPVHSSQSLRDPRPSFFAMLMVNSGWQDCGLRCNGESLLVHWSDAIRQLRVSRPDEFDRTLALLRAGVEFPDGVRRPLIYDLADQRDEDDFGVRMKSGLDNYLTRNYPTSPEARAIQQFCLAARDAALVVQLNSCDVVVVDNDRWGHGRVSVLGQRTSVDGAQHLNPRELWSATVA